MIKRINKIIEQKTDYILAMEEVEKLLSGSHN